MGRFLNSHRKHIVSLAAKHRLPACYNTLEFVHDGGLMSYGPGSAAAYRQVGCSTSAAFSRAKNPRTCRSCSPTSSCSHSISKWPEDTRPQRAAISLGRCRRGDQVSRDVSHARCAGWSAGRFVFRKGRGAGRAQTSSSRPAAAHVPANRPDAGQHQSVFGGGMPASLSPEASRPAYIPTHRRQHRGLQRDA